MNERRRVGDGSKIIVFFFVSVFFEPTDVPTAPKPFLTPHSKAIKYITPNLNELKQIASTLNLPIPHSKDMPNCIQQAAAIAKPITNYIPNIIVTLGSHGLLVVRRQLPSTPLLNAEDNCREISFRHYPAPKVGNLVNVSGAGDCLASGMIVGMLKGLSEEKCVSIGLAAAGLALRSKNAVPDVLFDEDHECWSQDAEYKCVG